LIEGIRKGRKKEFESFQWNEEPPDPQNPDTFVRSKLQWELRNEKDHKALLDFYRELTQLRKNICAFYRFDKSCIDVRGDEEKKFVVMMGSDSKTRLVMLANFNRDDMEVVMPANGDWKKVLDSSDRRWNGPGALLPDRHENNESLTIRSESYAVYSADARESH
jgi:maltooligosyltrehalose trehalohydrolase